MAWAKGRERVKSGYTHTWRRHQQEAEHFATPSASTTPKRVPSREERGGHLQDKYGKEALGATPRKQEQPG